MDWFLAMVDQRWTRYSGDASATNSATRARLRWLAAVVPLTPATASMIVELQLAWHAAGKQQQVQLLRHRVHIAGGSQFGQPVARLLVTSRAVPFQPRPGSGHRLGQVHPVRGGRFGDDLELRRGGTRLRQACVFGGMKPGRK